MGPPFQRTNQAGAVGRRSPINRPSQCAPCMAGLKLQPNPKMTTTPVRPILIIAAFLFAALFIRADTTSYAQLLKERDTVLSQILAYRESGRSVGLSDDEAISAAQSALYSFRRDVASSTAEKIKNQELLVQLCEKRLAAVKVNVNSGIGSNLNVLVGTDSLLQAKQILEELKLNGKGG